MDAPTYHTLVPRTLKENLEFRQDILAQAANNKKMQRDLWDMCSADLLFYVSAFCFTADPRTKAKVLPFVPYDFQEPVILSINEAIEAPHDLVIKKSRDMGLSWMILMTFDWRWKFRENESFLLVSRTEEYVDQRGNPKALFSKLDFLDQYMPTWMMPPGYDTRLHRREKHKENPANGSVIDGEATTQELAAGDRRTAMAIDEFGRFKTDDSYSVMSSTRDVTRCRIFNSSVRGQNNAFADAILSPDFEHKLWIPWFWHPEKNVGLYKSDGTNKAPDHVGKERSPWYDAECKRAVHPFEIQQELDGDLVNSSSQFFDKNMLTSCIERDAREPFLIGELDFDYQSGHVIGFREQENGRLKLWIYPEPHGDIPRHIQCAAGIDVAVGTGASNSAIVVANKQTGEKLAEFCDSRIRPEKLGVYAVALCRWFNGAFMVPEANGPGQLFLRTVIEDFQYGNLYYRQQEKRVDQPSSLFPGWWAGVDEKRTLFGDYSKALTDGRYINRSRPAIEECKQIVFTTEGAVEHSAALRNLDPSGAKFNHGDLPTADALCWKGMKEYVVRGGDIVAPQDIPVGSLAWRMQEADRDRELAEAEW